LLGGIIGRGDLKLYLSVISEDSQRYQRLGRQSKDILRRLQSETPNRLTLTDVMSLGEDSGIDLVDMYWKAERGEGMSAAKDDDQRQSLLIALFVTICTWYVTFDVANGRCIEKIGEDIKSY